MNGPGSRAPSDIMSVMYRRILSNCRHLDKVIGKTSNRLTAAHKLIVEHLQALPSKIDDHLLDQLQQTVKSSPKLRPAQQPLPFGRDGLIAVAVSFRRMSKHSDTPAMNIRYMAAALKLTNVWRSTLITPCSLDGGRRVTEMAPETGVRHRGGLPFRLGPVTSSINKGMLAVRIPSSAEHTTHNGKCSSNVILIAHGSYREGWVGIDLTTPISPKLRARTVFSAITCPQRINTHRSPMFEALAGLPLWTAGDSAVEPWILHSLPSLADACPHASHAVAANLWRTELHAALNLDSAVGENILPELSREAATTNNLLPRVVCAVTIFPPSELEQCIAKREWYAANVLDLEDRHSPDSAAVLRVLRDVDPSEVWPTALRCIWPSPPSTLAHPSHTGPLRAAWTGNRSTSGSGKTEALSGAGMCR